MLDQMAGVKGIQRHAGKLWQLLVKVDGFPARIPIAKFPSLKVDTVKVQIRPWQLSPAFPMRQSAIAGTDVQQVRAPGQRLEELKARVGLPELLQKLRLGNVQPRL